MYSPSVVSPSVARRSFVRWLRMNHGLSKVRTQNCGIFDTVTLHGQSYTISFLTNQMWDRMTDDIAGDIGRPEVIPRYFHIPSDELREYMPRLSLDDFSDLVLRARSSVVLVSLFSILYASGSRIRRIRHRRSSSLTKEAASPQAASQAASPQAASPQAAPQECSRTRNKIYAYKGRRPPPPIPAAATKNKVPSIATPHRRTRRWDGFRVFMEYVRATCCCS